MDLNLLLKMYETNRSAIISRVSYRDYCLMLYIGAAVGILSAAISKNNYDIILGIPFLSLGATLIIGHHHYVINLHSQYITSILFPYFKEINITPYDLFHKAINNVDLYLRFFGEVIFLILPSIIIQFIYIKYDIISYLEYTDIYINVCILLNIIIFIAVYLSRFKYNKFAKILINSY